MNLERANHGFGVKEVLKRFTHFWVLRAVILLRILFGIPEAESQDSIVVFVGDENGLIYEAFLFLQDRQYFVIDGLRAFPGFCRAWWLFQRFGCTYMRSFLCSVRVERNPSRVATEKTCRCSQQTARPLWRKVNCPNMVHRPDDGGPPSTLREEFEAPEMKQLLGWGWVNKRSCSAGLTLLGRNVRTLSLPPHWFNAFVEKQILLGFVSQKA